MATYAFSDDLPIDALKTLYSFAASGGTQGNKRDALRAALVTIDYAGQFIVGPAAATAIAPEEAYSALATHLKPIVNSKSDADRAAMAINWQAILALALQILPLILPLLKQEA